MKNKQFCEWRVSYVTKEKQKVGGVTASRSKRRGEYLAQAGLSGVYVAGRYACRDSTVLVLLPCGISFGERTGTGDRRLLLAKNDIKMKTHFRF